MRKPWQIVQQGPNTSLLLMGMMTGLKAVVFHRGGSTKILKLYVKYYVHSSVTKGTSCFLPTVFLCHVILQHALFVDSPYNSKPGNPHFILIHILSLLCLPSSLLSVVSELEKRKKILIYICMWWEGQQNKSRTHFGGSLLYLE